MLVAPQEFKGSLAANEAAAAIAAGMGTVRPGWHYDILPLSDGGPGFLDALRGAVPSDSFAETVQDPLGRNVVGRLAVLRSSRIAVIEAATANGLHHLRTEELDPLYADTFGVGQLLAAAISLRPAQIIVGVGGSATTDGGSGMARALGARFTDMGGNELPRGGAPLADLARIDWSVPPGLAGIPVLAATDVTNPLVGPNGAAAIFGPQKGASADDVQALEAALVRYASVVRRSLGVDISAMPGSGAAGGLAGGLVAFLGAKIVSGFDVVAEATHLEERFEAADLIVTGEGRFDSQSLRGKGPARLLEMARRVNKRIVVFAGSAEPGQNVVTLDSIEPDRRRSMEQAAELLRTLAMKWTAREARS